MSRPRKKFTLKPELQAKIGDFVGDFTDDNYVTEMVSAHVISQCIINNFFDIRLGKWSDDEDKEYKLLLAKVLEENEKLFSWYAAHSYTSDEQKDLYKKLTRREMESFDE